MSDPYKDIGFNSNRIGFGRKRRRRRGRFPEGLYRGPLPAWRASRWSTARSTTASSCRRAQGRPADRVLLHRLFERARRPAVEDTDGGQRIPPRPPLHRARRAHLRSRLRHGRVQDRAVDLLQHPGRHLLRQGRRRHRHRLPAATPRAACARASTTRSPTASASSCRSRAAATSTKARTATICATSGAATPTSSAWTKCSPISRRPGGAMTEPRPFARREGAQPGRHRR